MGTDQQSTTAAATSPRKRAKMDIKGMFSDGIFTFLVGPEEKTFDVHPAVLSSLSEPFAALMGNGKMKESLERKAKLPEIEPENFALFLEYAYTGNYSYGVPQETVDIPTKLEMEEQPHYCTVCGLSLEEPGRNCTKLFCVAATLRQLVYEYCGHCGGHLLAYKFKPGCKDLPYGSHVRSVGLLKRTYEVDGSVFKTKSGPTGKLVQHCKLYILADQYMMESLKQLCLAKLHYELCLFDLNYANIGEACTLIKYTNDHVCQLGSVDGKEPLQNLVLAYVLLEAPFLVTYREYHELSGQGGRFMAAIATMVINHFYV